MNKVPKLRFPEFSGEWEEKKLGNLGDISSGTTPLRSKSEYFENGKIPWIKTTDLNNGNILKTEELITQKALDETSLKILSPNTILVAMYGGFNQIGRTGITKMEATINQAISAISLKKDYSSEYVLQYLNGFRDRWKEYAASSRKDPNITKKDVESFRISTPSLPEQEKIALFLSEVDKSIEALEQEKELWEQYKKGMMQKIFSQKIRFKDENGNDYPEWVEKELGELVEESNNKTTINNQHTILSSTMDGIKIQGDYFNKQTASLNNTGYKIVPKGYFTYRSMSDTGSFTFNIQNIVEIGIVSPAYPVFKTKEKITSEFLYYYLNNSKEITNQLLALKEGGTRYALSFSKFKQLISYIPSLREQEKIADFLSSIDEKIETIVQELESSREFKKGLLQQMFV